FNAWSQSTNATVGGTVQDATGAFIPGVTVTATNVGTGIVTTVVSNDAGVYQFASLQPGKYEIKSELPGFQTAIVKDFQLGGAQQARLNFTLQVAAAAGTTIDVAVAADTLLATSRPHYERLRVSKLHREYADQLLISGTHRIFCTSEFGVRPC